MEEFFLFIVEKSKYLLVAAAVFLLLEFLRPAHRRQKPWRKDTALDLIYSFALPVLVYPASVLFSAWLIGQFWPVPPQPSESGQFRQTVTQKPVHGALDLQPDGRLVYRPGSGFRGMDRFVLKTEYNENTITRTFLVTAAPPVPRDREAASAPMLLIMEVDQQVTGQVTTGISGFFFQLRRTIDGWDLGWQLLLATFLVDLAGYWRHRLMHSRFLWPFHAIHHSPKELDWLSNERFHPVNTYISYLLSLTVLILFFEDPFIFALCMPLRKAYGMFIHANVNISYGPFDFVLASPLFHHWHHAASEMADKNYCTFFSFLDWMFGTYYLPKDKKEPASVGLAQDDLANRFWPQMVYPFIKLARMKTR
ncbi:MAG: sterol desaturase family protein [Nitrospinae bacterium]|nr:sterol desaturase family protein [Nitrospinota bacterium]